MAKFKTNKQIVKAIMEGGSYGHLREVFIVEAIRHYAERVVKAGVAGMDPNGFVNPEAWVGVAEEVKKEMDEAYGR